MKRIFCVMLGLVFILFLSGCFNKDEKAEELVNFMNKYTEIENDNSLSSLLMIGMYRGSNNEMDADKLNKNITEEIIPGLKKRLEYLEDAELEYKEMQELNESLTDHIKHGETLFEDLNIKLQDGTDKEIDDAREDMMDYISDVDQESEKITENISDLIDKYDVLVVTDYDDDGEEYERFDTGR